MKPLFKSLHYIRTCLKMINGLPSVCTLWPTTPKSDTNLTKKNIQLIFNELLIASNYPSSLTPISTRLFTSIIIVANCIKMILKFSKLMSNG